MIGMFIREVEEELIDEDIDEFIPTADRGDRPLSVFSADDITKLFERQISARNEARGSVRDSLSEGNLEPFKLNDRVSSRRSCHGGNARHRSVSEAESKARKDDEKKKKEQGLLAEFT